MEDFGHKLHQIFSLVGSDLGQFKLETQFTTYIVDKFVELINQFCFNNEHPFSFFRKFNNSEFGDPNIESNQARGNEENSDGASNSLHG